MPVRATLFGYGVALTVTLAGLAVASRVFPRSPELPPTTGYLTIAVAVCFLGSVIAAYCAARIAPDRHKFSAVVLLVLCYAATAAAIARLAPAIVQPRVVLPLTTMLAVVGTVAGAMIERAIHGGRRDVR
jgi:hypothetical protein